MVRRRTTRGQIAISRTPDGSDPGDPRTGDRDGRSRSHRRGDDRREAGAPSRRSQPATSAEHEEEVARHSPTVAHEPDPVRGCSFPSRQARDRTGPSRGVAFAVVAFLYDPLAAAPLQARWCSEPATWNQRTSSGTLSSGGGKSRSSWSSSAWLKPISSAARFSVTCARVEALATANTSGSRSTQAMASAVTTNLAGEVDAEAWPNW